MRRLLSIVCCLSAAACATETEAPLEPTVAIEVTAPRAGGTAAVSGTVNGEALSLVSAVAIPGSVSTREPERRGVRIVLTNRPGACVAEARRPGVRALTLDLEATDLGARTYVVPEPLSNQRGVHGRLDLVEAECRSTSLVTRGGTLTIEESHGAAIRGTFDILVGATRVTGRFEAPLCATPPSGSVDLDERCEP